MTIIKRPFEIGRYENPKTGRLIWGVRSNKTGKWILAKARGKLAAHRLCVKMNRRTMQGCENDSKSDKQGSNGAICP
jgi:hypothetical protein